MKTYYSVVFFLTITYCTDRDCKSTVRSHPQSTVDNHVLCHNRDDNDKRLVYVELPRKIKAIIVHKKYIIEQNLSNISQHDNVCVECTLLGDYGNVIDKYNKALFTKHCVTRHIGKSKNNLVVDNLS